MTPRRGHLLAAGLVVCALLVWVPAASAQVSSGDLRAGVDSDPWHLTITDGSGRLVLSENRGLGSGPTGTLGFSTSAGLMPRVMRNIVRSPTTLLLGVTFTMSPKSWFTVA